MKSRSQFLFSLCLSLFLVSAAFTGKEKVRPELYFHDGNTITFQITYISGATRKAVNTIESVSVVNGTTTITAISNLHDDKDKFVVAYKLRYFCDSLNWCVDPLNDMYITLDQPKTGDGKYESESDSLVYPFSMKIGDTLNTAWLKTSAFSEGMSTENKAFYYRRKVVAFETLTLLGTSIPAFKITYKISKSTTTSYGQLGGSTTTQDLNATEWFSHEYGVIKMEQDPKYGIGKMVVVAVK